MNLVRLEFLEGVSVLELDHPPAHAISRQFLGELDEAVRSLEAEGAHSLVIAASGERFFSAGLDLLDLFDLGRVEIAAFTQQLIDVFLRLFRLDFPVVAAVNGHAIAGGAILALCADRRILARGSHLFGLNEVQVGLPLPGALLEVVRASVGGAAASEVLLEGKNYPPEDSLRIGFTHEIVDLASLRETALAAARKMARVPRAAFRRMKEMLRRDAEDRIARWTIDDPFVDIWFSEETRRAMGEARNKLMKGKRS